MRQGAKAGQHVIERGRRFLEGGEPMGDVVAIDALHAGDVGLGRWSERESGRWLHGEVICAGLEQMMATDRAQERILPPPQVP